MLRQIAKRSLSMSILRFNDVRVVSRASWRTWRTTVQQGLTTHATTATSCPFLMAEPIQHTWYNLYTATEKSTVKIISSYSAYNLGLTSLSEAFATFSSQHHKGAPERKNSIKVCGVATPSSVLWKLPSRSLPLSRLESNFCLATLSPTRHQSLSRKSAIMTGPEK